MKQETKVVYADLKCKGRYFPDLDLFIISSRFIKVQQIETLKRLVKMREERK
ncbi:hypothetical protein P4J23_10910 [Bacillus cereus]|nr:hypothetical protein [Bacillus cereus]